MVRQRLKEPGGSELRIPSVTRRPTFKPGASGTSHPSSAAGRPHDLGSARRLAPLGSLRALAPSRPRPSRARPLSPRPEVALARLPSTASPSRALQHLSASRTVDSKLRRGCHPAGRRERDPSDATTRGHPRRSLRPAAIAEWFRPPRRLRPRRSRHFVGPERAGASGARWEGAQPAPLRTPRPRSCSPEVRPSLRRGEKPRSHVHQAGKGWHPPCSRAARGGVGRSWPGPWGRRGAAPGWARVGLGSGCSRGSPRGAAAAC